MIHNVYFFAPAMNGDDVGNGGDGDGDEDDGHDDGDADDGKDGDEDDEGDGVETTMPTTSLRFSCRGQSGLSISFNFIILLTIFHLCSITFIMCFILFNVFHFC